MKIARGISYHAFGSNVFVHNARNQMDYEFSGIALDILNYGASHGEFSLKDISEFILSQYEIEDAEEIQADLDEFISQMCEEKILIEPSPPVANESEIMLEVERSYARDNRLFSVSFEMTYRCPEKCIHCYIDDFSPDCAKNELTTDECKEVIRQLRQMDVVRVLLTGGEVLLRSDFCEIAEYAIAQNLIVDVYTTGVGLTDEIFDRMCAMNLNSVSFSLYSGEAAVHDAITKVPGSFERTLNAMLMFKAAGVNTFIKCVAMRQNLGSLESLYRLAKRLHIPVSVSPQIGAGHSGKSSCAYRLSAEQYEEFFAMDSRWHPPKVSTFSANKIQELLDKPPCSAGVTSLSIDPYGGVHRCVAFTKDFGSLRENTLQILWEKIRRLSNIRLRELTPHCSSCEYVDFCHVCVGDLLNETGGNFHECGDALVMAKARANVHAKISISERGE